MLTLYFWKVFCVPFTNVHNGKKVKINFRAERWWADYFQETAIIRRTFLVAFVPKILARGCALAGRFILTLPLPCLFVNFSIPYPDSLSFSQPPSKLVQTYQHAFLSLQVFHVLGSKNLWHSSQREPTGMLESSIIPQEPGELSQFFFPFFFQSSRFCWVCNVAIIPGEMGEVSWFPWWEIVKYLLGHRQKANVLPFSWINPRCSGPEKKEKGPRF